jgi:hypothetical protein
MIVAIIALLVALSGAAIAKKALTNKSVKKIANNQITKKAPGLSVASAKTAKNADTLGGQSLANIAIARSDTPGAQCDPVDGTFIDCATVSMTVPHDGRVLMLGTAGVVAFNNANTSGNCLFRIDGVNNGGAVLVGNQSLPNVTGVAGRGFPDGFSNTVVKAVSAGPHTFSLACNESATNIEFQGPQLSVALVGSG